MIRLHKRTGFLLIPLRDIMLTSRLFFSIILLFIYFYLAFSCDFTQDGFRQLFLINKSLFTTFYTFFYFFIFLNQYEYLIQLLCGFYKYPLYLNPSFRKTIIFSKIFLTISLSIWSVFVFLAGIDIWYSASSDLSFQWLILKIYYFFFFPYLVINVIEVFINWDIFGKIIEKKEKKRIEEEDDAWFDGSDFLT
jgi:hypothetical protein